MNRFFVLMAYFAFVTTSSNLLADEKIRVAVTIPPIESFVSSIGGDFVEVIHLVPAGQDLHTFAPKPSKMREMRDVEIYFKLGGIASHDIFERGKNIFAQMSSSDGVATDQANRLDNFFVGQGFGGCHNHRSISLYGSVL